MTAPTQPPFPLADLPRRPAVAQVRIGDVERNEACELLNRHFTAGRLTHSELEERLGRAVTARTGADLQRLFGDLPRLPRPSPPAARPTGSVTRSSGLLGDLLGTLMLVGGLLAIPIVMMMLLGSLFLGPGVFVFSLIGGSLAATSGAALARLVAGDVRRRPR